MWKHVYDSCSEVLPGLRLSTVFSHELQLSLFLVRQVGFTCVLGILGLHWVTGSCVTFLVGSFPVDVQTRALQGGCLLPQGPRCPLVTTPLTTHGCESSSLAPLTPSQSTAPLGPREQVQVLSLLTVGWNAVPTGP